MERRKMRAWSILLALVLTLTIAPLPAGLAHAAIEGGESSPEKPMQSETEFVVALDVGFAEEVLSGKAELFMTNGEAGETPSQGKNKAHKKIPPGLLKKGFDAKDTHIRNLERYIAKHLGDAPALITVEVEDKGKMEEARAAVEACEGVLYTDPLTYYYADGFNDPLMPDQWALNVIDAFDAWDSNTNLPSVVIAVLDTGVRLTHEDLAESIIPGYDFVDLDADPTDMHGHGTHVAGIAAAINNNGKGIASPAGGAKILPVRVLGADGRGNSLQVADGIYYAAEKGADIINMSLGSNAYSSVIDAAVRYAQGKGCLVIAASGNDYYKNLVSYPAAHDGVIIAASLTENADHIAIESDFSNYRAAYANRTIHAPGDKIISTDYSSNSSYSQKSGTSMAAPYVSGMAAALLARGGFSGSLFDKLLNETVSLPRYYKSGTGVRPDPSGAAMKVLNDNGNMDAYKNQVFKVTFGGSGYPMPEAQYVRFGDKVAEPEATPVLAGYSFLGWKRSGDSQFYNFSNPVYSNLTINSTWEIIQKYKVSIQSDGNGYAFANVLEALAGTEITAIATPNSGYRFKEWNVVRGTPDFSSLSANPTTFTMPKGSVTVKAVFEPVADMGKSMELQFAPVAVAANDDKSVVYLSDKDGKKVYSINTETFEQESISFSLMPESMYYKDGKLYVSLCERQHSYYWWAADQIGAYAIVDCESFTVDAQHDIDIDPYSIVVSNDDIVYISSGSGQGTYICGYDKNGDVVAKGQIRNMSPIKYNSSLNKIYAINTDLSPRGMSAYVIQDDGTFYDNGGNGGTYFRWPYHGTFSSAANFAITPDDKYIFNGAGYVIECKAAQTEDMIKIRDLDRSYVDVAFDLPGNSFYISMTNKNIHSFNYDTFKQQKSYSAISGVPERIFLTDSDIIAITKESSNKYFIEQISKSNLPIGMYSIGVDSQGNGAAAANASAAEAGEVITIAAMPDDGSAFKEWQVDSGSVTLSNAGDTLATFTMPRENVSITAVFEQIETPQGHGAVLSFAPADAVSDDDGAFIYLSDKARKRVYRVNTATFEQNYISFSLMPESMYYKGGKLYVSLCEQEHSSFWWNENQRGAYAVIDCASFTVASQCSIDFDPYDIVVSDDGIVYIGSGSGQWTYIYGFDHNGSNVAKGQIRQQSPIEYNSALNKIYAITTDLSPRNMSAFVIQGDGSFFDEGGNGGTYYNWPYHGAFSSAANFKVSPDGKHIFNGIGYVLDCSSVRSADMVKTKDLGNSFKDIAFDLAANKYYIAPNNNKREIQSFRYDTCAPSDLFYLVNGNPERVFIAKDGILALAKTDNDLYCIEWASSDSAVHALGGAVSIIGEAKFGQKLTVDITSLTSYPGAEIGSFTYQWKRTGEVIAGATGAPYTPVLADIGQTLTATVAANGLPGNMTSGNTLTVAKADGPAEPAPPTMASKTSDSITLNAMPGAEYMRVKSDEWGESGGTWQDSPTFSGLAPNTSYVFFARIKETATHGASPISLFSEPIATDMADEALQEQTVTFDAPGTVTRTYGDAAFTNVAKSSGSGTIYYSSSDASVAAVNSTSGQVTIYKSGTTTIVATAAATSNCNEGAASYTLTVRKAGLTIKPKDMNISANAAIPAPTVEYSGLKYNDIGATAAALASGTLDMEFRNAANTGALASTSAAGTYKIVFTGSPVFASDNYVVTVGDGALTITAAESGAVEDVGGGGGGGVGGGGSAGGEEPKEISVEASAPQAAMDSFPTFIQGFEDGTFRGDLLITREQFVTILARLKNGGDVPAADKTSLSFSDVAAGRWSYDAIEWSVVAGIAEADADGNFRPAQPLTRADMATMLVKADNLTRMAENTFSDIDGHPAADYILKATAAKIFTGYPDGTFKPDGNTKRDEAVAAIARYLLGGEPEDSMWKGIALTFTDLKDTNWAYKYIALAVEGWAAVPKK
ncbi:MAG: S8 family serine peptidase [Clostridiales bacterium]|nr:S8 family serine peptidase [Clostridiales bacterium]